MKASLQAHDSLTIEISENVREEQLAKSDAINNSLMNTFEEQQTLPPPDTSNSKNGSSLSSSILDMAYPSNADSTHIQQIPRIMERENLEETVKSPPSVDLEAEYEDLSTAIPEDAFTIPISSNNLESTISREAEVATSSLLLHSEIDHSSSSSIAHESTITNADSMPLLPNDTVFGNIGETESLNPLVKRNEEVEDSSFSVSDTAAVTNIPINGLEFNNLEDAEASKLLSLDSEVDNLPSANIIDTIDLDNAALTPISTTNTVFKNLQETEAIPHLYPVESEADELSTNSSPDMSTINNEASRPITTNNVILGKVGTSTQLESFESEVDNLPANGFLDETTRGSTTLTPISANNVEFITSQELELTLHLNHLEADDSSPSSALDKTTGNISRKLEDMDIAVLTLVPLDAETDDFDSSSISDVLIISNITSTTPINNTASEYSGEIDTISVLSDDEDDRLPTTNGTNTTTARNNMRMLRYVGAIISVS